MKLLGLNPINRDCNQQGKNSIKFLGLYIMDLTNTPRNVVSAILKNYKMEIINNGLVRYFNDDWLYYKLDFFNIFNEPCL